MPTQLDGNRPPVDGEQLNDGSYFDSSSEELSDMEHPLEGIADDLPENEAIPDNSASEHEVPGVDRIHVEEQADIDDVAEARQPVDLLGESPMGSVEEGAPNDIHRSPSPAGRDMFMPPYMDGNGDAAFASAQPTGSRMLEFNA